MVLPIHSDGDHVHEACGNISIEEEREDSAELRTQGPLFVHISDTREMKMKMKTMKMIWMKTIHLEAVRGRLMALKRRSETAKLILRSCY